MRMFARITNYFEIKAVSALAFSLFSFFFDILHKEAMIAVFILIIFDFITAVHAALRIGEDIKSAKVFRTAVKISSYFLLISASYTAEKAIPFTFLDETVIAFLAVTELISIVENTAKAGYAIPKSLLEKLKSFQNPL